ncbi:MAG: hypothetical protein J7K65_07930 [Planctomycetes bacterium]|nr:hypothetical protein [Planctomycetota bacterium]
MSDANEQRNWQIYADFAQVLIAQARTLYADELLDVQWDGKVYAIDATTIDLCLSVFPWAKFRHAKAAIKLHTKITLRGNIPEFIHIPDGTLNDVNALDLIVPEPGAFYYLTVLTLIFKDSICSSKQERVLCRFSKRAFFGSENILTK